MATPESDYFDSLGPEEQDRLHEILDTWRGLGIVGCGDCRIPECVGLALEEGEATHSQGVSIGQLTHYAIELNGIKRPPTQRGRGEIARLDEYEESALYQIAVKIGIPDKRLESFSEAFQDCIACPGSLTFVGDTPSFSEAIAILEAETQKPLS